jgi:hypothetical protein
MTFSSKLVIYFHEKRRYRTINDDRTTSNYYAFPTRKAGARFTCERGPPGSTTFTRHSGIRTALRFYEVRLRSARSLPGMLEWLGMSTQAELPSCSRSQRRFRIPGEPGIAVHSQVASRCCSRYIAITFRIHPRLFPSLRYIDCPPRRHVCHGGSHSAVLQ